MLYLLDVKISKKVAQSAALSVINSHRCPATGETTPASQPCNFSVSEEKKMEVLQSLASHRGIMKNTFWGENVKGLADISLKVDFADNIFPVHRCQYLLVFLGISCLLFPRYSGIVIYFEVD